MTAVKNRIIPGGFETGSVNGVSVAERVSVAVTIGVTVGVGVG